MAKRKENIISIDLNVWQTQAQYAKEKKIKLSTLSYRVLRSLKGTTPNPIECWQIPELGITLVKK
jgi:hypothetical protein